MGVIDEDKCQGRRAVGGGSGVITKVGALGWQISTGVKIGER